MRLSIRLKLLMGFSIVLLIFAVVISYNIIAISESNMHIMHIKETVNKQVEYSSEMNTSVIEVQQWFTDAALTKSADSLKEAEKYRTLFKDSLKNIGQTATDLSDNTKKIDQDFDSFYGLGTKMAEVYINEGAIKGNELMAQFDPLAEKIITEVEALKKSSQNSLDRDLDAVYSQMNLNREISIVLGLLSLIAAGIIVLLLGGQMIKPINGMLQMLRDLEKGQGDLTKRINIKSKDEIGSMAVSFNNFMDSLEEMVKNIKMNSYTVSKGSQDLRKGGEQTTKGIYEINNHMSHVAGDSQNISQSIDIITKSIAEIATSSQATASDRKSVV